MAIFQPATGATPIIVQSSGTISTSGREIVSIHYLNTTAGVGRVDITDGTGNRGIVMGAGVANGTDDWCPAQPAKFDRLIVTFTTGTGFLSIQTR